MSLRDSHGIMASLNHNLKKDKRLDFSGNLIAHVNIETGQGFCRIKEYWQREGVTDISPEKARRVEAV
ncbi:hypothetical protein [Anaerosolibacter sp.]|uniref:hypothetical protein n=1 Tax=Anaerosolibacter sp. TaxID=1872527 RepID=UPI0039F0F3F5